jgi:HAD superfamily hydrolase (TIGR01509 family)
MAITGFVFDFDGLILDTEVPHFIAWQEAFKQHGFSLSLNDWWKIIGTDRFDYDPEEDLRQKTQGKIDLPEVKRQIKKRTADLLQVQPLLPGVESFIVQAHRRGLKMAIASSSSYDWVLPFLEKFGLTHYFEAVLTADDVKLVKPDPSLYILAAKKLGFPPNKVIAFEDSLNGVKSAKSAGLYCVAVPNLITKKMDFSLADKIVSSFDQLSIQELCCFDQ